MSKATKPAFDPDMAEFEAALLLSVEQGARREGRVTTAAQIQARRGRPPGSVKAQPKVATTIRFDQDVLDALKASGRGWQTRVNDAMRAWLEQAPKTK